MSIFSSRTGQLRGNEPKHWGSLSFYVPVLLHLLLAQKPIRQLSQSLIIILMLISPLSFSSDSIPNFSYECPVSTACSIKISQTAVIQKSTFNPIHSASLPPTTRYALATLNFPQLVLPCSIFHSRAPPA